MSDVNTRLEELAKQNRALKMAVAAIVVLVLVVAWRSSPAASFDKLSARELSIVDDDGDVLASLRPVIPANASERGASVVFSLGKGDRRIEMKTINAGAVLTVGGTAAHAMLWAVSGEFPGALVTARNGNAEAGVYALGTSPNPRVLVRDATGRDRVITVDD